MMRILGLIPARGGSKGIPGKNSKLLGSKPLIAYTIEAALQSAELAKVVVSTDDEGIAEISRHYGAKVPFMRPKELAQDDSPTIDTVVHALQYFRDQGEAFDALCLLQPTTPFRTSKDIRLAVRRFREAGTDCLVSVREVPHQYNPHWVFLPDDTERSLRIATGEERIIPRRQALPKAYHRDGSVYITKSEVVLEQKSLYGNSIGYIVLHNPHQVNLDTPDDWRRAEQMLQEP
ncbi:MAG: acylneuraminate cytidylyltransferase family protein [Bacteroidota bacterium]